MIKSNIISGTIIELPTKYGHFKLIPFQEKSTSLEHIALIKGDISKEDVVLTRMHSSCATGDIFGSLKCDCGEQLIQAMKTIEDNKSGIIIYLQQEGRGIGLMNKIMAYKLQEDGMNTVEANLHLGFSPDERDYGIAAEILKTLGVRRLNLLTNNPDKIYGLEKHNIEVVKKSPLIIKPNPHNKYYLDTKASEMGHELNNII